MKLYRSKVADIAKACIAALADEGMIEVLPERREEAEKDLIAIMDDYLRRDTALREGVKDHMSRGSIPYDESGRVRKKMAEDQGHPLGDDVERFLVRQFVENLMISPFVDEVFEEDRVIYKKLMDTLRTFHIDEEGLRKEAADKIKNIREGTVEYEIAMRNAMRDVMKRKGLY